MACRFFEMVGSLSPEVKNPKSVCTALKNTGVYSAAKTYHDQFYPCQYQKDRIRLRPSGCCRSAFCAIGIVPEEALKNTMVVGEISLSGEVKPVNGILPYGGRGKGTRRHTLYRTGGESDRGAACKEIEIFAVQSIAEMIHILNGGTYIEKEIGKAVAKTIRMLDFRISRDSICKESL